jgi:hypothetical protein
LQPYLGEGGTFGNVLNGRLDHNKESPATFRVTGPLNSKSALKLGRQIAVDFKANADFDECRRGPGHDCFL